MSARPSLSAIGLWDRHERLCLRILARALAMLSVAAHAGEDDLNRELYRCIIAASHAIAAEEGLDHVPAVVPEGRNPPAASDQERAAREHKIPDFYWAYIDHHAVDPTAAARQFVVECKRLTTASASWIYTEQYVRAGVSRFVTPAHGYGMDAPTGAMVGYLQTLTHADALTEVNAHLLAAGFPELTPAGSAANPLAELEHQLQRSFPDSPFRLVHLWVRS